MEQGRQPNFGVVPDETPLDLGNELLGPIAETLIDAGFKGEYPEVQRMIGEGHTFRAAFPVSAGIFGDKALVIRIAIELSPRQDDNTEDTDDGNTEE